MAAPPPPKGLKGMELLLWQRQQALRRERAVPPAGAAPAPAPAPPAPAGPAGVGVPPAAGAGTGRAEDVDPAFPYPVSPVYVPGADLEPEPEAPAPKRPRGAPEAAGPATTSGRNVGAAAEAHLGLPKGWAECPRMGQPLGALIPCKVPLGQKVLGRVADANLHFAPKDAVQMQAAFGRQVGMVIDLTNTWKYYDPVEWDHLKVQHVKVACRGRGAAPDEEAVNRFFWIVHCFLALPANAHKFILVHCTHGFNRTGYMICSYFMRTSRKFPELAMARAALENFRAARPPGIYKPLYIETLFRYHHQPLPANYAFPPLPAWKDEADVEDDDVQAAAAAEEPERRWPRARVDEGEAMSHEDELGEPIPLEYHKELQKIVCGLLRGFGMAKNGRDFRFAGSQPVSVAQANLDLLRRKRYRVTWKADGTRYMLLAFTEGAFLIDRKNRFRRVQMRFPTRSKGRADGGPRIGQPHHGTLLDGEMIVDEDLATGRKERRYLIYDMMAINGAPLVDLKFVDRHNLIEREVVLPRKEEAAVIQKGGWTFQGKAYGYPVSYAYDEEPFFIRRKGFYPLEQAGKLLDDLIPNQLTHESDGLILQPADDGYVPGTCYDLLKWKYAHMNSVDFYLHVSRPQGRAELQLQLRLLDDRPSKRSALVPLEGAEVAFPATEDPADYHQKIVECAWSPEMKKWTFMRERPDKEVPNAHSTYTKVWQSIEDDIRQPVLLKVLGEAAGSDLYGKAGVGP